MSGKTGNIEHTSVNCKTRTFADLILDYLAQIDVEFIFGVPGGAIEPLYNALARQDKESDPERPVTPMYKVQARHCRRTVSAVHTVVARHEAGAAFMADGYARETGKLGVCCATTGPGATNLITGVASAYADRIPMLVITAQTALPSFGNQGLQESSSDSIDTVGMFEHCTHYNSLVSHPNQLERKLFSALVSAYRKPRGPSHISIPKDILDVDIGNHPASFNVGTLFRQPIVMDEHGFDALRTSIRQVRKPVLFLGSGCAEAIDHIIVFSELIGANIVTTPSAKGLISAYHPLYRGVFGFAGHSSARDALLDNEVDMVLAIGTRLGELATSGWDQTALLNEKMIHIDSTMENFIHSPMAQLHVYGHLKTIILNLIGEFTTSSQHVKNMPELGQSAHNVKTELKLVLCNETMTDANLCNLPAGITLDEREKCLSDDVPIKPQRLMLELASRFPADTRFLSDAGNSWAWTTHYLHLKRSGNYRIGMGFGAMAWAIGAAVGTALGCRGTPVVCITGDGSFLMSGQELTVAVAEKLPVVFVVLNDQALGMVKHGQRLGSGEPIAFELPPVDFCKLARSMGAQAWAIRTPDDFDALDIDAICKATRPTLLDVYIDEEEVPPMKARMKVLDSGTPARN